VRAAKLIGDGLYGIDIKGSRRPLPDHRDQRQSQHRRRQRRQRAQDELYLTIMRCFHERLEKRRG
jgi:hypothetical protein